jgi:acyl-homoserine lactone acylase PvdQ
MHPCLRISCLVVLAAIFASFVSVLYVYRTVDYGTLAMPNAPGTLTITREDDTGIAHIRGDSLLSTVYGQGFAHAQTRLWQMER